MEYLMGLNEKNEPVIQQIVEKSSKKIVRSYYEAIKSQHKQALKAIKKAEQALLQVSTPVMHAETTDLVKLASFNKNFEFVRRKMRARQAYETTICNRINFSN